MKRNKRGQLMAEINVVPYIDVMLVLLVIFMVTAPLLTQGVKVSLPQASANKLPEEQKTPLVVSVDAQGQYYLNASDRPHEPLPEQKLAAKVAAYQQVDQNQGQSRPVYVKGDQYVSYGKMMRAMVLLQKAGIGQVGLITKNPDQSD